MEKNNAAYEKARASIKNILNQAPILQPAVCDNCYFLIENRGKYLCQIKMFADFWNAKIKNPQTSTCEKHLRKDDLK